jgi:hypothetical protein
MRASEATALKPTDANAARETETAIKRRFIVAPSG